MHKYYFIVKDGIITNTILWDKEAEPDYQPDGEVVDMELVPSGLTQTVQDLSGNDIEVEWRPGIGDKCVIGREFKKTD